MMFRFPSVICTRCTGFFCLAIIKGPPNDIYCIIEEPYKHYFTEKVSYSPFFLRSISYNFVLFYFHYKLYINLQIIPCELLEFSLSTRPILFQFFKDLIRTHPACQQLLQYSLCFGLLSFFSGLSICLCLLRFQGCHFFFGLLQSRLLLFQVSLQSVNVGGDGCDLSSQGSDRFLLLRNLGCVVVISFGTVFTAFHSGHRDNLFPFLVV